MEIVPIGVCCCKEFRVQLLHGNPAATGELSATLRMVASNRPDYLRHAKHTLQAFMTRKQTVAWSKARFESLGLVTFHPDPSSVVLIVLADVTTRRQPHSVALFVHRGVKGYK